MLRQIFRLQHIRQICYRSPPPPNGGYEGLKAVATDKKDVWKNHSGDSWYGVCFVCTNVIHATDFRVASIRDEAVPICTNCPVGDFGGSTW